MATLFSIMKASIDIADDSSLSELMGHGSAAVSQTKDIKSFVNKYTVAPGASQVQIDFSTTLTTGYRWALFSDYPIMYRTNSVSGTQKTLASGNVAATNNGAPLPYSCFVMATEQITGLWLQPIAGATTTANVKVLVCGDPTSAYV